MAKFFILNFLVFSLLGFESFAQSLSTSVPSKNIKKTKKKKNKKKRSTKRKAKSNKSINNIVMDADFSLNRGDAFRALKLYEYVREKSKSKFYSAEVYPKYLKVLHTLGSSKVLVKECSSKIKDLKQFEIKAYSCARAFYRIGNYQKSLKEIRKVKQNKSPILKILEASNYLALNSPKRCVKNLKKLEVPAKFLDLKSISLARCDVARRNFMAAVSYYKNVSSDSKHYMDALYEMAWAQFKDRSIGDTKATIDVVLSSYSDFSDDKAEISQREYFNLRYLRAYLGIVQSGASDVAREMDLALGDLNSARKRSKLTPKEIDKIISEMSKAKRSWRDLKRDNSDFRELVSFLGNWGSHYKNQNVIQKMKYHLALSFESKRLKVFSDKAYRADIKRIFDINKSAIKADIIRAYAETREAMNGFELRIQLAKYKTDVLQATKGVRSLEQAKEIYTTKEGYLNRLVGGIE